MRKLTAGLVGLALTVTGIVALPTTARAEAGIGPWVTQVAPDLETWRSVAYGDGLFVAVSDSGDDQAMTSPDGFTWTPRDTPGSGTDWNSVAYGDGLFVAVSRFSDVGMYSSDGINWTQVSLPAGTWLSVAYGGGRFVAVSDGDEVAFSANGTSWSPAVAPSDNEWSSITYGAGQFVAVATGYGPGVHQVMTSPDGADWSEYDASNENEWTSVTYGGGQFVAVACGCLAGQVMTSPDGITWTARTEAATSDWTSVVYGNGLYVAVAQTGGVDDTDQVMTSPDGITWTIRTAPENYWNAVAYGSGVFAAIALTDVTEQIMISYTPTVLAASPSSGLPAGGTAVTLTGTSLADATAVDFGGVAATSFAVVSATQISAVAPAHAVGAVDVVVTTPGGVATKTSGFTYAVPTPDPPPTPPPTPTPVPVPAPTPIPTPITPAPVLHQESMTVRFVGQSSRINAAQRERIRTFLEDQSGVLVSTRIIGFATEQARAPRIRARDRAEATARFLTGEGVPVSRQPARLNGNGDTTTFPERSGRVYLTVWSVS